MDSGFLGRIRDGPFRVRTSLGADRIAPLEIRIALFEIRITLFRIRIALFADRIVPVDIRIHFFSISIGWPVETVLAAGHSLVPRDVANDPKTLAMERSPTAIT